MAFWPFNQHKAAPERSPKEAPEQPSIFYLNNGSSAALLQWNDSIAAQKALQHPMVSRAIDKIATSVSQVRWFVEKDPYAAKIDQAGKERQIQSIQSLLDSPTSEMTPAMLRYWLAQNYCVYGRVPVNITFGALDPKAPNAIYPLEADKVYVRTNSRGVAETYDYGTGETKQTYVSRPNWVPGKKGGFVDQIWKPSLKGFQHADERNSPLHSLGLPIEVTRSLMIRAIKSAQGHPNVRYLVTCSKLLTKDQQDVLKKYLNEDHGPEGLLSGKVPVLQNAADIVINKLDNDLSDIHSKVPLDDMARLIYGGFGIPVALMGIGGSDAAKFTGNYDVSRNSFWEDTVIPSYISPLFQGLTRMLCPVGIRISPDIESIPALVAGRILSMKDAKDITFLTETEKREMFGFEPVPQEDPTAPRPPPANPSPVAAEPTDTPKGKGGKNE